MRLLPVLPALLLCATLQAQPGTAPTGGRIEILGTDRLEFDRRITAAQRLLGHVRLQHASARMGCDSAWLFEDQTLQAFGHVTIDQDTVHVAGDRLDYDGGQRRATLTGQVRLTDPGMELVSEALTYDLRERQARYGSGAVITSRRDQNTLTSRQGRYLVGARRFIFSDSVQLRHPERSIDADTLHYTTTTGVAEFFGPTRLTQGRASMWCERGSYDTRRGLGRFARNARIEENGQVLRGDSLRYDRTLGLGEAWGHVVVLDTAEDLLVRGDVGRHWQREERSMITGRAELVMLLGGDSLFLHADTLFASADSGGARRILAHRHVRFFKSDMQGVCDTMRFSGRDSLITLHGLPYLWSGRDQVSGRTIAIALRNGRAHRLDVERDGLLAADVDSAHFDQVSGTRLTGWFAGDQLASIDAEGNCRTVYFAREQDTTGERITGVNRADCSRIRVRLDSGRIETITFVTRPAAVLYPMEKAPVEELRMKGFVWNAAARPTDRWAIFAPVNGSRP
jgi:lipopolysaccharide export system protein LptA